MADIKFACSHCGRHVSVDESAVGCQVMCTITEFQVVYDIADVVAGARAKPAKKLRWAVIVLNSGIYPAGRADFTSQLARLSQGGGQGPVLNAKEQEELLSRQEEILARNRMG